MYRVVCECTCLGACIRLCVSVHVWVCMYWVVCECTCVGVYIELCVSVHMLLWVCVSGGV